MEDFPRISSTATILFAVAIIVVFLLVFAAFWYGWWLTRRDASVSPYSGMPLRKADGLSYSSKEKVVRFLHAMHQYENPIIEFRKAALCRETGRLFPNAVTWYDTVKIDWTFIQKRYPGHYVSWGSLNSSQREDLISVHDSLEGFQVEFSSQRSSPRMVESGFAFAKPGPLYVDVNTGTLVGWKSVPDSDLEVLVVQKPIKVIVINVPK